MSWFRRFVSLVLAVTSGAIIHSVYSGKQIGYLLSANHLAFLHLVATSISVGVQLYVTFIFGIVAFKNLPRRTFGVLQSKLFPIYFQLMTVCGAASLYCFYSLTRKGSGPSAGDSFQLQVLLAGLGAVLANLVYLEPKTSEVMFARHRVEDSHPGASMDLLKSSVPEYKKLSSKFGMFHGMSSLLNLISLSASMLHMWYLSTRLGV